MLKSNEILSLLLIVSFSGCGNSNSNSSKEETTQKTIFFPIQQSETFLTQQSETTTMMLARLSGVLEKDKNGCLRVNGDLIIWPYSSTIADDLIYDKNSNLIAEIGESVTFGGGGFSSDEGGEEVLKNIEESSNDLPSSRCSEPYFFVDSVM